MDRLFGGDEDQEYPIEKNLLMFHNQKALNMFEDYMAFLQNLYN